MNDNDVKVEVLTIDINELTLTEKNPRIISKKDFAVLKKSIKDFPSMLEVGEIAHEVSRNRYGADFRDAIGDALVTLIILADIASARPMACLELAYREIKDRKGKTENGTFVKEERDGK